MEVCVEEKECGSWWGITAVVFPFMGAMTWLPKEITLPLKQSEWNLPSVNGRKSFSSVFDENTAQKGA
jgi:hypothetical protein